MATVRNWHVCVSRPDATERGLDCCDGGVDLYNFTQDGVGMPTVADSFAAIEQRVVNEKRLTWKELKQVLDTNYEGAEDIRLMLKNINRYGSGGSLGDKWAMRIRDLYVDLVKGSTLPNTGYNVIPGMFSHGIVEALGRRVPATPNGRKNGEGIAHNIDPDPCFIRNGQAAPTAKAVAVANCQPGWGNSAPLQIELDTTLAKNAGGIGAVENRILTHNEMGGTLININILSKRKIDIFTIFSFKIFSKNCFSWFSTFWKHFLSQRLTFHNILNLI